MGNQWQQFPGKARYRKLGPTWMQRFGSRVHKVTLRGGFGCPNRDGRIGFQGCLFCSEHSLLPATGPKFGPIQAQLEAGLAVIKQKNQVTRAIAYFQDQTATDASSEYLSALFLESISHPDIVALAVGTRPDWIQDEVYALLGNIAKKKPVFLELGLQSANEKTLRFLNRGHTLGDFNRAVTKAHQHGLEVVAHVILDLPQETKSDRKDTATCLNQLRVDGVKIHNLHVLTNTPLAYLYERGEMKLSSLEEYVAMTADFLTWLHPRMVIHRLTGEGPTNQMIAPSWGRDKKRTRGMIEAYLEEQDLWQGKNLE